jgi:hypothetical protein
MATQFYPELVAGKTNQDGTRALEERFSSFGEVIRYDPWRMVTGYPQNLWQSLRYSFTEKLVHPSVAALAWLGILLALLLARTRQLGTLLVAGSGYLLLMGLNHWETRYYFFIAALYAGFATFAVATISGYIWRWLKMPAFAESRTGRLLPLAGFAICWVLSFSQSRADLTAFLDAQPWEIAAARDYLISAHPTARESLRIVARKPHLPFMTGGEWVFFPAVKSLDELHVWLDRNHVDYIVIGRRELKERKELAPLAKPERAPAWLKPVWVHDQKTQLILYRVVAAD